MEKFNTFIDFTQNTKAKIAKTFISDKDMTKMIDSYINAETAFAKSIVKSATDFYTSIK
jgi:hypothetical protein